MKNTGSNNTWIACIAAAMLTACTAVGPDYESPRPTTPEKFSESTDTRNGGTPITRWWSTFGDADLDRLIDQAVSTNRDVRVAAARVREARALYRVTDAQLLPSITTQASYDRSRSRERASQALIGGGSFTPGGGREYFQAGFDASWEIDLFGGVQREIEAAVAEVEAADEARRDVLLTVLAEVARNYLELRGFELEIGIVRKHIGTQQATVDLTRARFAARVASELDVMQAEAELALTQAQIPTLESEAKRSLHRLSVLLGEPTRTEVVRSSTAPLPARPPRVPAGFPAELLRRRPDLRRAEREVAAATARVGVATADLYPRFSLTGSFGLRSAASSDLASAKSQFWDVHPSVSWPLFDFGRIRADIAVQDARVEQAVARYEQAMLLAFEDVDNALVAYQQEEIRNAALARSVDASRGTIDLAQQLFDSGVSDFLRVLDAQRALYSSENQLAQSDRVLLVRLVALYKALGGGWEAFAPEARG